jgi:peroxiredoxin
MARFASLSDSDLTQILEDCDCKNTKSVIKLTVKVLNDYLIEKNGEIASVDELDLSDTSVDIVVATLKRFYGEIRKADGTLYAKKSMITLRFGLQ